MTRMASLLIVLVLAAAPAADSLGCLVWCMAAAHPPASGAECHKMAQNGAAVAAATGECGILLAGTPVLREEVRRNTAALASAQTGPIARSRPMTVEGGRIGLLSAWTRDFAPPASTTVLRI